MLNRIVAGFNGKGGTGAGTGVCGVRDSRFVYDHASTGPPPRFAKIQ